MPTIVAATMLAVLLQTMSDPKKTDRDFDNLIGPVHIVRTDYERTVQSGSDKGKVVREQDKVAVYDRSGRLIEEISFGFEACTLSRHLFRFDGTDTRTETVSWGKGVIDRNPGSDALSARAVFKQVFKFDSAGKRSEVDDYDPSGKLHQKTIYKYDVKGRVKEETTEDANSIWSRCLFKYDQAGFVEEEACRRTGSIESEEKSSYKYEFDPMGNWTKRKGDSATSFNGKVSSRDLPVAYRAIEYYSPQANPSADLSSPGGDLLPEAELKPCAHPLVIRKSGGAFQASATKRVTPAYPASALAQKIAGSVVVELTTDEMGKVISTRTISGPVELRSASEEAAKGWEFAPTFLSKMPVKVIGTITFNYSR